MWKPKECVDVRKSEIVEHCVCLYASTFRNGYQLSVRPFPANMLISTRYRKQVLRATCPWRTQVNVDVDFRNPLADSTLHICGRLSDNESCLKRTMLTINLERQFCKSVCFSYARNDNCKLTALGTITTACLYFTGTLQQTACM
ncbi:hypothetical protein DPMN_068664 [Dreissena polymorpha]|uniref:Uncharacterized protein n=1 Tax=Dreissena polymorpha TaxID=45954 RepID=A0A9D4BUF4_DREPO|nr:hypothetical protein DPMN_068664 [Dreissena polymorpha]